MKSPSRKNLFVLRIASCFIASSYAFGFCGACEVAAIGKTGYGALVGAPSRCNQLGGTKPLTMLEPTIY